MHYSATAYQTQFLHYLFNSLVITVIVDRLGLKKNYYKLLNV